jgi:hypothetical protein
MKPSKREITITYEPGIGWTSTFEGRRGGTFSHSLEAFNEAHCVMLDAVAKGKKRIMRAPEPTWVKCNGEAHRNPMIDHCSVCMPYWHDIPICPYCREKLRESAKFYNCRKCHKRFKRS